MSSMTPEEIRLRDEAIASGRVVRPAPRRQKERKPSQLPDRVYQPVVPAGKAPAPRVVIRSMSIQRVLEWAFADEKAHLSFDETDAHEFDRGGVDGIWVMMQRAKLGCMVDGGGSSPIASDAQIIAAEVAHLPEGCGGRQMVVQIAELAKARCEPDWGQTAKVACVPQGYDLDYDGKWTAHEEKVGEWSYWDRNRNRKTVDLVYCPVSYTGTAYHIRRQRQNYLAWYGALLHLQSVLSYWHLDFELTNSMPVMTPWRIGC